MVEFMLAKDSEKRVVKQVDKQRIPSARPVRAWHLGENIIEVVSTDRKQTVLEKYRKLNKEQYLDLSSGEILDYKLNENRSQNLGSLRKTFHNVRRTINANFSGGENELFLTLTYKSNMTDTKKLYNDFQRFWKALKFLYEDKYCCLEYINIIEPQERGAWHCHVLVKCEKGHVLYIPNDIIYNLWSKKGWTKTKRLSDIDNIGAYVSAYLADIEINDNSTNDVYALLSPHSEVIEKEIEEDGKKVKKKFIKGGRLKLYGSMTNIIRCSRGIVKPNFIDEPYSDVKKIVGFRTPNYSKSIAIYNSDEQLLNSITYENYNLKRS